MLMRALVIITVLLAIGVVAEAEQGGPEVGEDRPRFPPDNSRCFPQRVLERQPWVKGAAEDSRRLSLLDDPQLFHIHLGDLLQAGRLGADGGGWPAVRCADLDERNSFSRPAPAGSGAIWSHLGGGAGRRSCGTGPS